MSKRGISSIEAVIAIIALLAAIAVPSIVNYKSKTNNAKCEEVVVEECGDVPEGYKLQRRGDQWRVASTTTDWHSSYICGSRKEAVEYANLLAGWKDEVCSSVDRPKLTLELKTTPVGRTEYQYEIYSNGKCYFWYDKGCGISARRFSSCAEAICGVEAYFRMLSKGDAAGTKCVLTEGMNWPMDQQGYNKVKSGVFKCEPEAKPSDDCGCC